VFAWLFVIERLPEASPIVVGANLVMNVVVCPSANVNGSDGPLKVKPPPDATAWVIVMADVPEFVRVRLRLLLEPIPTFPKLRFLGLSVKFPTEETHPDCVRAATRTTWINKNIKGLR
jgi:hypothetical protein